MKSISTRTSIENWNQRKVKVFDIEKKKLIYEFDSLNKAEIFLGVKGIHNYIKNKTKSYKNNIGIAICFR